MAPPPLELFLGPLLVLVCIALTLFGVTCAQVYSYWTTYERDPPRLKGLVLTLLVLELAHSVMCLHMLYVYFVEDIGNPLPANEIVWSAGVTIVLEVLIVAFAQGFSIVRIRQLSGGNIMATALPTLLLLACCGFSLAAAALLYVYRTWPAYASHRGPYVTMNCGLVLKASADLTCTVLLTYYLHMHKSSFKATRHMVQKLVFYTINTGALTMAFTICVVFMYNFVPNSLMFGGMVEIVCKLYANSTLALLNARQRIKSVGESTDEGGMNTIPLEFRGASTYEYESSRTQETHPSEGVIIDVYKDTTSSTDQPTPSTPSAAETAYMKDAYRIA